MQFKSNKSAMVEVNMTPMIDIVFQLIAFFMVVINFEQTQADERVKLPRDELARPPEKAKVETRTLNIGYERDDQGNITKGPFIWLPGATRDDIPSDDPRYPHGFLWPQDKQPFVDNLARIKRSLERDEKLKETTILIRADAETPGGVTTDLIAICQEQGFEKFEFSATAKGGLTEQDEE